MQVLPRDLRLRCDALGASDPHLAPGLGSGPWMATWLGSCRVSSPAAAETRRTNDKAGRELSVRAGEGRARPSLSGHGPGAYVRCGAAPARSQGSGGSVRAFRRFEQRRRRCVRVICTHPDRDRSPSLYTEIFPSTSPPLPFKWCAGVCKCGRICTARSKQFVGS